MIERRRFLYGTALLLGSCRRRLTAGADAGLCKGSVTAAAVGTAPATVKAAVRVINQLNVGSVTRFVDRLPIPPVLRPDGTRPDPEAPAETISYFRVPMREITAKVHRDLPPTRVWTYAGRFPGPTFETRSGKGLLVEWVNELPDRHFLPIDHNLCGAGADRAEVRTVVHVHGARVPPESDGHPESWYAPGGSAVHHYPNRQDAATLWYHDHAMGIERLNQYAGLFGMFLIRDEVEDALRLPAGEYELPIVLCDRTLDVNGQLVYPTSANPNSPWVPEVYGDAVLANGKLFPYLEVQPRLYRFRLVNASNARFLQLTLSNGRPMHLIGTDQGFVAAPTPLQGLVLAPAERADLLVDFSASAGQNVTLKSISDLVQFRVAPARGAVKASAILPAVLRPVPRTPAADAVKTRFLTLNHYETARTRKMWMLLNGARWQDPVTERPQFGTTEIWELANLTEDSHPIHLHLVRFQILERQPFNADLYTLRGTLSFGGPPEPPLPQDAGWKDTVRVDPNFVTRIIVKFDSHKGRYLWHCHILEHAANEMMRPFEIVG
ncbi:MAG TPA: multicopper oxidase domain-containing protein [Polyangiaceae bacterium]|nr:multicopper oxidase domain-containing protein [Polyangiaceae bacterium]